MGHGTAEDVVDEAMAEECGGTAEAETDELLDED